MWEFSLELRYGVDCAKLGRDIDTAADALAWTFTFACRSTI
jgi:hypothetical protein